ncbi:MAG TPA: SDR family oxidoreductase [Rubrivivax sp.]|nr:SDR family oxidoreductase [Rubrivivax sp.]HPO20377.1 SDR family oxidoreductase [Rubrivivax sp.]
MELKDQVVVVTGGGSGIGRALCERFAAAGARGVVAADLNADAAREVAAAVGGIAYGVNVADEADVKRLVDAATERFGRIDLMCSNAGVILRAGEDAPSGDWQRHWEVNVMAQVYAARAVLPQMLARGSGYLLHTASAAGLLSQVNAAPYSVTKHAAVGFAEWLSIAYGERGIRVSCLCPQGVRTPMLRRADGGNRPSFLADGALSAAQVADCVVEGLRREQFLILPHPEVLGFFQRKAADYERWLRGMRRLRDKVVGRPRPLGRPAHEQTPGRPKFP